MIGELRPLHIGQRIDPVATDIVGNGDDSAGCDADRVIGEGSGVERRVETRATVERVVAAEAVERVVAGPAGDDVGQGVAGSGEVADTGEAQVLDVGAQGVGVGGGQHRVGALGRRFHDHVEGAVDGVGVIAQAADQHVVAAEPVERVIAGTAGDHVGQGVAGTGEVADPGEGQVLDVGAQGVDVGARQHRIGTRRGQFGGDVEEAVDGVDVVAQTADHRVVTGQPVEHVVAGTAGDDVGQGVAGSGEITDPGEGEVLDVGAQGVGVGR